MQNNIDEQYREKIDALIPKAKEMTQKLLNAGMFIDKENEAKSVLESKFFHRCMNTLTWKSGLRKIGPLLSDEHCRIVGLT